MLMTLIVLSLSLAHAQDSLATKAGRLHAGKVGLGIDGITGSTDFLVKYFFNNQLALQLIAGFDVDLPGGPAPSGHTKVTGFTGRGGLSLVVHLSQDQVSPYVGVEGVYEYAKAGGFFSTVPDPKNSLFANGVLGGEYFMSERFTIGIKQALGARVSLKRDVPREETDITLNTSTVVTARFYFN